MNTQMKEILAGVAFIAASVTCLLTGHVDAASWFGLFAALSLL